MNTKQLKQKILSLAIAGRLVPQDPTDEPASELIKRINPKAKPLETEQPLPEGWCATTLSTLCELTDGENVQNRELINLDAKFLRGQREGNKLKSGRLLPAGSLVILVDGENSGEVFRTSIEGYQGSTFKKLVINKNMHEEFVLQVINSHRTRLKGNKKGSAIPHLNKKLFREIQVPVPPLAEQKRITKEVERWFAKIDQLEHDCEALSKFGKRVRKKLLAVATSGRLVPQDPSDGSASELLRRINHKATPIQDDVPYEIPDNWAWCRIKDVFIINPKNKAADEADAGFVPMGNISEGFLDNFRVETKKWKDIRHNFTHFANGDIAVAKISPCLENRKSMILRGLPNGIGAGTTELHVFRPLCVIPKFFLYFAKTGYFINKCTCNFSGTVGQKRVGRAVVANMLFPLPPLAEQRRIVKKLESLFAVLDSLDKIVD